MNDSSKAMLLIIDCKDRLLSKRNPEEVSLPLVEANNGAVESTADSEEDLPASVKVQYNLLADIRIGTRFLYS